MFCILCSVFCTACCEFNFMCMSFGAAGIVWVGMGGGEEGESPSPFHPTLHYFAAAVKSVHMDGYWRGGGGVREKVNNSLFLSPPLSPHSGTE